MDLNKVTLRRTRLVLGWVTVRKYTVWVCNQPQRPTQLPTLNGTANEHRPRDSGIALAGKVTVGLVYVALAELHRDTDYVI